MKKIRTLILALSIFLTVPIISMEQDPIESIYQKLGMMDMREMRTELKTKNDEILLQLLAYRGGNIPILIANATSWELLDHLCQEDILHRFFETGKPLPFLNKKQEAVLKSNFFRFIGFYIAHPAPNEKQTGALKLLQEMPESSIADFAFVGNARFAGTEKFFNTQKLLVLKNDYKTIELFNPYREKPTLLNSLVLPGPVIQVYVGKKEGNFIPSCVTAHNAHSFSKSEFSILGDKITVIESAPIPKDVRRTILLLFHDLSTQKISRREVSLENLLFLTYLYRFQHFASEDMPLDRSFMEHYNALPKEIRDRLNLKFESRGKPAATKKAVKKAVSFKEEPEIKTFKPEESSSNE